jgi:hypothetical protein
VQMKMQTYKFNNYMGLIMRNELIIISLKESY